MKFFFLESNPLDEFSINFYTYTVILSYSFQVNSIFLQLGYVFGIIGSFYLMSFFLISDKFQYLLELVFKFIFNFFKEISFSVRAIKYFMLYLNIFLIILISNLTGLIHYSKSIMAQFIISFFLAILIFIFLIILGFILYKIYSYKIIEPENVPKSLFLLILLIEFFSFLIRPFSLAIRLFANMLAGHMLLMLVGIFILFIYKFLLLLSPIFLFTILIFLISLEFIICFIQAYVFLILFITYLEQLYKLFIF